MKIDPHNHREKYLKWKERSRNGIPDISKVNTKIIMQFMGDMEKGINIASGSRKGSRSYVRLNSLRDKLIFFSKHFKEYFNLDSISKVSEDQLHTFFANMRNGIIKRNDGKTYTSVSFYVKIFKSFWHWHIKCQKKEGKIIQDITVDLDTTSEKPKWVYLTEEQVRKLCDNAKYEYKILIMFLFDSGIRSPTELVNVRVSDFYDNFKKLMIRDEVSKTFGRKINLMLSSELIKEYVKDKKLNEADYLFTLKPYVINKYLKRLALSVLEDKKTLAGDSISALSMYDFRHCSACYWLPRYKSEAAMKYRFGWKKSEMIHYYTEFLGMKDTISEEDMFVDVTKTEIEQQLVQSRKREDLMQERLDHIEKQMAEIMPLIKEAKKKGQEIIENR